MHSLRLTMLHYREDMTQAIAQEHAKDWANAAISYKKAQHHARSAEQPDKARFAMARQIHCLKMAHRPEWRTINGKYQTNYLQEVN
ncbi:hypothetical protein ACV1DN_09450 [Aeromonas allosaccharophila]